MPGFSNVTNQDSIMYAGNCSFDGTPRDGAMNANGQLWIGSTVTPHVRRGNITSTGGTITVTNGAGTINLEAVNTGSVIELTGDDGLPVVPDGGGNIDILCGVQPNGFWGVPLYSYQANPNALTIDTQFSVASNNPTDGPSAGISYFSDADFTVNADGFVELVSNPADPLPAFQVELSADLVNVLGNNVTYTVPWDTEVFDITSSFNTATGIFTAPSNGIYYFSTTVMISQVNDPLYDLGATVGIITPTKDFYGDEINTIFTAQYQDQLQLTSCVLCQLTIGDDVYVNASVASSGASPQTIDIESGTAGAPKSYFSGFKVGNVSTSGLDSITGDDTVVVVPDINGNINLLGSTVPNATNIKPVFTTSTGANDETIEVQLSTASATNNDPDLAGLAYFSNADFTVNADGFVEFIGSAASQTMTGDDLVATNPVGGNMNMVGLTLANGTFSKPVYFFTGGAGTENLSVQISKATAIGGVDEIGLCSFDDSQFTVDGNGWVQLAGSNFLQTVTGDDTVVTSPIAGNMYLIGNTVGNATYPKPVFTTQGAAGVEDINVQLSTASANAANPDLAGLCYFDPSQFTVNGSGYVQITGGSSPVPPVQVGATGLGIKYSASTFSICYHDGTNLSATNVGYVGIPSKITPGVIKQFAVTANASFIDATGASQVAGAVFSLYPNQNWLLDMPFYIYALMDVTETTQVFAIARIPHGEKTPVALQIAKLGTGNVNTQLLILDASVNTADYALSAAVCIGSFRVTKTGGVANDWTVTALDFRDGINLFNDTRGFNVPLGCFQAAAGTHWWNNGGTAPVYATNYYKYYIKKEGLVSLYYSADTNTTPGAGAVTAGISIPYNNVEGLHPWGYLGTGHQETFAGASCDIINWQPDSTGNFSSFFYTNPTTARRYINQDIRGDIRLGCTYQIANFIQGD
jgi:hypothetical protein